jgi:hypothetical protein
MLRYRSKKTNLAVAAGLMAAMALPVMLATNVQAAALNQVMVRFDRMQTSTATTGTVCAMPPVGNSATEASTQVTFPTGYTLGLAATFTVSTTNLAWPSGAVAWPGVATATNVTGQVVTFPSTNLAASTLYCFNWTNSAAVQVTATPGSTNTGTVTTRDNVPATIDTASYVTSSINADQITVSATVPQSFSFALGGTSDSLGTLSSGSVSQSSGVTATVNTNAKNGFRIWARDANAGLSSASASKTIPAAAGPLSAGTEGYAFGVTVTQTSGSGTPAASGAFAGGVAGTGGALATTLAEVASSAGTANNAVFTLRTNAAISGITPAATDYTDIITVIGAGLF